MNIKSSDVFHEMFSFISFLHFILILIKLLCQTYKIILIPFLPSWLLHLLVENVQLFTHFTNFHEFLQFVLVFGPVLIVFVLIVSLQSNRQEFQSRFLYRKVQVFVFLFPKLSQYLICK